VSIGREVAPRDRTHPQERQRRLHEVVGVRGLDAAEQLVDEADRAELDPAADRLGDHAELVAEAGGVGLGKDLEVGAQVERTVLGERGSFGATDPEPTEEVEVLDDGAGKRLEVPAHTESAVLGGVDHGRPSAQPAEDTHSVSFPP
jgi:hypothetical protein